MYKIICLNMKKFKLSTFQSVVSVILITNIPFFITLLSMYQAMFVDNAMLTRVINPIMTANLKHANHLFISKSTVENWLFIISIMIMTNLVVYIVYLHKKIFFPLELITNALESNHKKSIKILKNIPGEFGNIGNLFQIKDNQKFELVTAKIKAEESERLKSTFLENLSHEIRTPMNAIVGFTDLMLTTNLDENEKHEYLSIIYKSGKNLVSIIEDLLEMSKIDTNQIVPNYTDIDIEKCLIELYNTIKVDIPKSKKIDFYIIESNARLFYNIKVDEVKLKQIIINLVYNAIKFTETGYVAFGYEIIEEGEIDFIEFTIKDTGIGISKENQRTIFDRFKRVESDLTIEKGGLGLGLAITKAYVEMMDGRILIHPNQDKGTVFTFRIPLKYDKSNKIETNQVQTSAPNLHINNKTILIAEDDNINFLLIKKMFQITNYNLIRAANGKIAVDIVLENPDIDMVLMDLKMPVMNGYESFDKISLLRPKLPIIAQTAHASEEDKEKIYKKGFADYITKPINKTLLIEMVSKHLQ